MNRHLTSRSAQQGLGLFGLLVTGIVAGFLLLISMKVFPTASEFWAIRRAVQKAANEAVTPMDIQRSFANSQAIDDFTSITGKDLVITRSGDKTTISFAYEKRIPLFGPASLLLDYRGSATR